MLKNVIFRSDRKPIFRNSSSRYYAICNNYYKSILIIYICEINIKIRTLIEKRRITYPVPLFKENRIFFRCLA